MTKILIIGIKGMAGHMLYNNFLGNKNYELFGIARNITDSKNTFNIDVSNTIDMQKIITDHEFDIVINCIGILNNDAESNPAKAIWFNSYFPHYLEEITKNSKTKIIHISTDCVFSGQKGGYSENDFKDGYGYYAQSKALGEIINNKDLTIRTSIIGPEINDNGIGLFHWFITQSYGKDLKGFTNAFWSGITTLELSNVIEQAIIQDITGLIQIAPEKKISKFDLLVLFNDIYRDSEMTILPDYEYKIDKSLISIRRDFKYEVPSYEEQLKELKKYILNNKEFYSNYTF